MDTIQKRKQPPPLRVMLLKRLANKKFKCIDCNKQYLKYQMYICPTCNKPMFCKKCLKNISSFTCTLSE